MSQIPTTRTAQQASEVAVQDALPLVGSASREDGQTVLNTVDSDLARLYEDKNILLTDGGTISWTGSSLSFTSSLKLEVNSRTTGVAPVIIDLGATTRDFSADGRMLYAVIDRTAGTATVTADVSTLPATVSANKELFLIAKRKGTDIVFRNGFSLAAGESSTIGKPGVVLDTRFAVGDATDSTKQIKFDAAGTTGTATTITGSQTANRVQTLQDTTDTFVYKNTTDLLTNKELAFLRQSVATDATTTGTATTMAAFTTGIVRLTNISLVSLAGIPAGVSGQNLTIENKTGNAVSILNEDVGATAANRILTGTSSTVTMLSDATFIFTYDSTSQRWQLTGGSGSGSGSGGGVNFIPNGNAEADNPFISYQYLGSTTRPIASTGAPQTAVLTSSITAIDPLAENNSFLITKGSPANQQTIAMDIPFTVDPAYRGKACSIEFDYLLVSGAFQIGTTTQDSDLIVYIIDVDNNVSIEPSNFKFLSNSTTVSSKFSAQFQTSINSLNYRLSFYTPTTNTAAYSMKLDNISVGPSEYVYGSPETDFISYVPTTTGFGTITASDFWYKRVGDAVVLKGRFTAGTTTATIASISLPAGMSIDPVKVPTTRQSGVAWRSAANTNSMVANLINGTNTVVAFSTNVVSNAANPFTAANANQFLNTGEIFAFETQLIPITGLSSSVQMSDQTDTRVVATKAYRTGVQSFANGVSTKVQINTSSFDTHAAFDLVTNNRYTVVVPGIYEATCQITYSANGSNERQAAVYKNGSPVAVTEMQAVTGGNSTAVVTTLVQLTTGDYLEFYGLQNSGGSLNVLAGESVTFATVNRLSGPSAIAANESVNASYYASVSGTASTTQPINYDTRYYDSHNSVTTGINWRFTAPINGIYRVNTHANIAGNTTLSLYKNGIAYRNLTVANAGQTYCGANSLRLLSGEYIEVRLADSKTYIGTNSGGQVTAIDIEKVGN